MLMHECIWFRDDIEREKRFLTGIVQITLPSAMHVFIYLHLYVYLLHLLKFSLCVRKFLFKLSLGVSLDLIES